MLYESSDPYRLTEPAASLTLRSRLSTAQSPRDSRDGLTVEPMPYTMKLEGPVRATSRPS